MYELSAIGVPMISFSFVDNQEKIVETFYQKKITCYGGNYLTEGDLMAGADRGTYDGADAKQRTAGTLQRLERYLVDGNGANRIAEELCRVYEEDRI